MNPKHELAREAHRRGLYADAERLARETDSETPNSHTKLNIAVAQYAQGKITKNELDDTVHELGLQDGSHGQSVLERGY